MGYRDKLEEVEERICKPDGSLNRGGLSSLLAELLETVDDNAKKAEDAYKTAHKAHGI